MSGDETDLPERGLAGLDDLITVPEEPEELIKLGLAGDWEAVIAFLKGDYVNLISNHYPTVAWLYRVLPPEAIEDDPVLRIGREAFATTYGFKGYLGGRLPDDPAELERLGSGEDARDVLTLVTGQIVVLRRAGQFQAAISLVEKAEIIAEAASRQQREAVEDVLGTLELQWGISRQLAGDFKGSTALLLRSYTAHMRRAVEFLAGISASHAALSFTMMGLNREADRWLELQRRHPTLDGWVGAIAHIPADVARLLDALDRLDRDAADAALDALRTLHQNEEFWAYVDYAFAHYELTFGHPLEGLARLEQPQQSHVGAPGIRGDGIAGHLLDAAALDLLIAAGRGSMAMALVARSGPLHPLTMVGAARLSLKRGEYDAAVLQSSEQLWDPASTPRVRADLSLITVAAEYLRGDEERAVAELRRAVSAIEKNGLLRSLLTVPREILEKLAPQVDGLAKLLSDPLVSNARELYTADIEVISLTDREIQVLRELISNRTLKEIADSQFVSLDTIRSQRLSLYRKLGAHSHDEAVIQARALGLL